jgi:hypothetical protein
MDYILENIDLSSQIYLSLDIDLQEIFSKLSPLLHSYSLQFSKQFASLLQTRFWVRNNNGFYQHPDIEIELLHPLQKSRGIFQSDEIRDKLYVILYEDYKEYNHTGLINYTVFINDDPESWVYISMSDSPIQETSFSSYGPLPKGTEYRSYRKDSTIIYQSYN